MNPKTLLGAALFATAQLTAGASVAAQSCSDWLDQGNGTSWAVCVDDNGFRHCWLINNTPGSTAYEVSCSG
ncbi:MAG: hypothetical protein B7Z02_08965 [Rhodobacterales bacterium 32-67-9]|nr:MAG: hypothetical protein B7Z02_08965 [Rhodobacterales bacterium 32-67-9]